MTSPDVRRRPLPERLGVLTATACLATLVAASGCGKEEEPVAVAPPQPTRPVDTTPPPPAVRTVADLMAELGIDDRIYWPEAGAAGLSTEERIAVLTMFDGFATGEATVVEPMLEDSDRRQLELMQELGMWVPATETIEEIALWSGMTPENEKAIYASFARGVHEEAQLWTLSHDGYEHLFTSVPTPPMMPTRLEGQAGERISQWFEILEADLALADEPDQSFEIDVNLDEESDEGGEYGGGPSSVPSFSPGGGSGRRPTPPPRRPPGPGGHLNAPPR